MDLTGIGEFARLAGLSPKALRLYDELETFLAQGPLTPASRPDCDFAVPLGPSETARA